MNLICMILDNVFIKSYCGQKMINNTDALSHIGKELKDLIERQKIIKKKKSVKLDDLSDVKIEDKK